MALPCSELCICESCRKLFNEPAIERLSKSYTQSSQARKLAKKIREGYKPMDEMRCQALDVLVDPPPLVYTARRPKVRSRGIRACDHIGESLQSLVDLLG
jgi:hypothetical protein